MVSILAAQGERGAARQMGALLLHDFFHLRAHAAQIAPVHVGVHIKNRPHVVVVDDHRRGAALNRHQVGEKLRAARHRAGVSVGLRGAAGRGADGSIPCRGRAGLRTRRGGIDHVGGHRDRRAQQRIQRIDPVLRRLHANVVVDAVGPVHPKVRRHLAAAAERDQHVAGDVALRQTQLRRLDAIHVQADLRLVDHLVNVNVGRAGDARNPVRELLGNLVVGVGVSPDHLQIDGRGKAEVQNLGGDIGRLEEEGHVGKPLAEAFAEQHLVIAGRAVLLLERNQDFAVGAGDGRDVALGETGPATYGIPMLSISVSISSAGITSRISLFDVRRTAPRSLRCACRPERAPAAASGRSRHRGRNPRRPATPGPAKRSRTAMKAERTRARCRRDQSSRPM